MKGLRVRDMTESAGILTERTHNILYENFKEKYQLKQQTIRWKGVV